MTAIEVKTEIQKALDDVSDDSLSKILDFINHLPHKTPEQIKFDNNLRNVLEEDKGLFERLAK